MNSTESPLDESPHESSAALFAVRVTPDAQSPHESLASSKKTSFDVNAHDEELRRTHGMLRMLLLLALCFQTTSDILLRSYSKHTLHETYSPSSVLFVSELLKLMISICATKDRRPQRFLFLLRRSAVALPPAACYILMNLLQYDAIGRVDSPSFAVCSQLKILASAILSYLFLSRIITPPQWRALVVLICGISLIVHQANIADCVRTVLASPPPTTSQVPPPHSGAPLANISVNNQIVDLIADSKYGSSYSYVIGVAELMLQGTLSGAVSVYLESYLKRDVEALSIWEVNIQLASWSTALYASITLLHNPAQPFAGWSTLTILVAGVMTCGGILIALCLRYTDAVLKNFPTAISVMTVSLASSFFLDGRYTFPGTVGALLVVVSIFSYMPPSATVVLKQSDAVVLRHSGRPA